VVARLVLVLVLVLVPTASVRCRSLNARLVQRMRSPSAAAASHRAAEREGRRGGVRGRRHGTVAGAAAWRSRHRAAASSASVAAHPGAHRIDSSIFLRRLLLEFFAALHELRDLLILGVAVQVDPFVKAHLETRISLYKFNG
jgi:hypothetical protein